MANKFKEKLKRDEVVVVVNPDHPSPSLTEFVAGLGFDGVFIDCEHGTAGFERVQEMCRAARVAGVQSIVRPESDAPYLITRYLDAGAGGVMVPHVETAATAKQIVETVRYARPKDHSDKVIIIMLESTGALSRLDEIVAVEGVDVFFMGPSDLSQSMGIPGQTNHPRVKTAIKEAAAKIRAAGQLPGTLVVRDNAAEYVSAGCRYLYEHANNFMSAGARDFAHALDVGKRGTT
jgi:4-hydroxy-2-oxoheptanedioate aldolase